LESKAVRCFNAQLRQFDRGQRQFISHQLPTTQDIVALAAQRTQHQSHQRHDPTIAITALELAQAEGSAFREVSEAIAKFLNDGKYGHAPQEKPSNSIRIVMENFNSLCVTSGNKKITTLNNLCRNFKVDVLWMQNTNQLADGPQITTV
jgi:hypothetical protein